MSSSADLVADGFEVGPGSSSAFHGHQTARKAAAILVASDSRSRIPTREERDALTVAFAMRRRTLPCSAFDAVKVDGNVFLEDPAALAAELGQVTVYEVKSTNRVGLGEDLARYFFNITAAELMAAQSLGAQYRFAFVNTLTKSIQEMSLPEVLARAKAFYLAWHIRF